jgi:hypothetical protein
MDAGDVTAGMAAHAVGDDEELRSRIAGSWLLVRIFPDVRNGRAPCPMWPFTYRRSSKLVVPIRTGV